MSDSKAKVLLSGRTCDNCAIYESFATCYPILYLKKILKNVECECTLKSEEEISPEKTPFDFINIPDNESCDNWCGVI